MSSGVNGAAPSRRSMDVESRLEALELEQAKTDLRFNTISATIADGFRDLNKEVSKLTSKAQSIGQDVDQMKLDKATTAAKAAGFAEGFAQAKKPNRWVDMILPGAIAAMVGVLAAAGISAVTSHPAASAPAGVFAWHH